MAGRQARKSFKVNGNEYAVQMMDPVSGFRFGVRAATALSPILTVLGKAVMAGGGQASVIEILAAFQDAKLDGPQMTALAEESWQFLILPNNELGKNLLKFQEWFNEHPEDMFAVSALAVWKQVEDFFPAAMRLNAPAPRSESPKA
jgi:hypothetical protein